MPTVRTASILAASLLVCAAPLQPTIQPLATVLVLGPSAPAPTTGSEAPAAPYSGWTTISCFVPLVGIEVPPVIEQAELQLDQPTTELDLLLFVHKSVLDRLLKQVSLTRRSIAALELTLVTADSQRSQVTHTIRPARPTLKARVLLDLIVLWLSSGPVTDLVDTIVMRAIEVGTPTARQLHLFERQENLADDALQEALSRLVAAFGSQAVVRPTLNDCHRPEARLWWERANARRSAPKPRRNMTELAHGPSTAAVLCLCDPPQPIELMHDRLRLAGENRWQPIRSREGPCTIEGEWWDDGFRRDYLLLTTEELQVLWVFRDQHGYYLHAYLD